MNESKKHEELPYPLGGMNTYRRDELPDEILEFLKGKPTKETDHLKIEIKGDDLIGHKFIPAQKYTPIKIYSHYSPFQNKKGALYFYELEGSEGRKFPPPSRHKCSGGFTKYHPEPTIHLTPIEVTNEMLRGQKRKFVSGAAIQRARGGGDATFCSEEVLDIILKYAGANIEYRPIEFLDSDVQPPEEKFFAFECVKVLRAADLVKNEISWVYYEDFDLFHSYTSWGPGKLVFEDWVYDSEHLFYDAISGCLSMSPEMREALKLHGGEKTMCFLD